MDRKIRMDNFEAYPPDMLAYLRNYGYHFSRAAFDFAVKQMRKSGQAIQPWSKEEVDALLVRNSVKVKNDTLYDVAFIANMANSKFYGSSIADEATLAKWIANCADDDDQEEGFVFVCWYASMMHAGKPIDWRALL